MKKVILLALLMPLPALGQIVENFESGSISNWVQSTEGHWKADTTASLSGRFSLHHIFDNPDAGTDQIGIDIKNLHPSEGITRWSFLVRYGYDPSSLNNWSVFLMSDNGPGIMSPETGANGFAIGVNLTGSDDTLRLWKIKDKIISTVINCRINWQTDIGITDAVKVIVERSQEGNWTVSVTRTNGSLIGTTSGTDNELFSQGWFGLYYKYSSTRDRLLWIDDIEIEGTFYQDNEPPLVSRCESSGKNSLKITLNEEPDYSIMVADNFSLNVEENKSISIIKLDNLTYIIEFESEFTNRSVDSLIINKLCDAAGNCSQNVRIGFTSVWAKTGDVVISEIMADPLPEVSLPGKEYIEITNTAGYSFNLKNWKLSTTGQSSLFPESTIAPAGIIILCAQQDTLLFQKFGRVLGMKQFPSLTDAGRILFISDSTGNLIHGVEYSSDWYKDDLKSKGGWSLEMIDTKFPFYYQENWKASVSKKGGTPGAVNSVSESNPDNSFYGILNVFPADSTTIHVRFSESVFNLRGMTKSIKIGEMNVSDVSSIDPLFREFTFKPADPLQLKEFYRLVILEAILDFAGNRMQKCDYSFGLTQPAEQGDMLFNEVLFNPLPGDPDYLELYNCSEKVIDASRLQLISLNDASDDKSEAVPVSDEQRCILPGEYYAITTDTKKISDRYFSTDPGRLFKTSSLPSMPDDKGHLILYNKELDKVDELVYNDDMHYSVLPTHEGIALEKTNPRDESGETANWHSATESSGWGTPGAQNSMFVEMPLTSDKVVLSSSRISPENDGNEDFLTIKMNLKGNGNVVTVIVFDETGNYIRKIAANLYAGPEASLIWDGTADDGSLVKTGIYIILITLYDDTGKTERWKKVCTVIRN
jgi:Lamin Tail Domain/FlgD Ig-like domain